MRAFCRDLSNSIPDVMRINRGKMSLDGVAEKAIELGADRIIIVDGWHEGLGKLALFQFTSAGLRPVSPTLLLSEIRLRRELEEGKKRAQSCMITVEPKTTELERIAGHLSKFLSLPVMSLDEAAKSHCASLHISLDPSRRIQITLILLERMVEIGPRVTVSKLVWEVQP